MTIIAADSSGIILHDDNVWFVVVKRTRVQKHAGVHISRDYQNHAKSVLKDNWIEKLSAILYYKSINTLYEEPDCIQIDKDFQGKRATYVKKYLEVLFRSFVQSSPAIEFITVKKSRQVKEAHLKTKKARYG